MRRMHTAILAGAAALLVTGAAVAATAKTHTMEVALPDGGTAHIEYEGDVAPKVTIEPAQQTAIGFGPAFGGFADFDRLTASMEAQRQQMLQQLAALQQNAAQAQAAAPGRLVASGNVPEGSQFTMVSSSTDANGCTRTVRISSDGSSNEPQKTETSSGKCGKADTNAAPAPAEEKHERQYLPGAV